jgi:hypothetical protein
MPNSQFHTAISIAKYSRYLNACGNKQQALKLYRLNLAMSQKLFSVIGVFEIILRNSIDRHMISKKGNFWLEEAVLHGGYLDTSPGCDLSYHAVQEAIHKLGIKYTHDRLIAKFTFGFWTNQFHSKEFAASGSTLLEIFVNRPFGVKRKDVYRKLMKINEIRNRIAHHEPICFEEDIISIMRTERRYMLILELLEWLGCRPKRILYGINGVQREIKKINAMKAQLE